ncbi:MAG: YbhN family protein [Thermoanaerobaculia bacterium]
MDAPVRDLSRSEPGRGREGRLIPETPATQPEPAGSGLEHLGRRLLIPLALGLLALIGLVLVADARKLAGRLRDFDLALLLPVLGLSLINYTLRFVRWEVYLKALGVRLDRARSLGVFLVGFLLSVTPGKAGELGKAWLVRELGGGPALRVVPAVVAERVTDLLGVLVLLSLGALPFPGGSWIAAAGLAAVAAAVLLLTWQKGADLLFKLLERLPFVGPRVHVLTELYGTLRGLLSPGLLAMALGLAVVAWGAEGVGFFLVVREYAPQASLLAALFNYTVSTCLGSLSMLPGGLLAAEGSLTALLDAQGLDTATAASATLIIRAATLWFAVFLGLVALPYVLRKLAARRR